MKRAAPIDFFRTRRCGYLRSQCRGQGFDPPQLPSNRITTLGQELLTFSLARHDQNVT